MSKPFKTLDEQIEVLKTRDLSITDENRVKQYLLTNNYYNVINGYSKFFTIGNSFTYINTTDFREIESVYLFDKEIKSVFLHALIEAEKHFKSVVAYRFSERFRKPYAYLRTSSYKTTKDFEEISNISKLIGNLSKIINSNIKKKIPNSIRHYHFTYQNVPFWVLCNEMTFGQIISFFDNLDEDLRNKIAYDLSTFLQDNEVNITGRTSNAVISASTLSKFLKNANEFRNIAAHNNLLFKHRCWKRLKQQSWFPSNHQSCNQQGLYYVFLYLRCLLSASQYAVLHNTLLKRIWYLRKQLYSIPISKILYALDFPKDWDSSVKIPQTNTPTKRWKNNIDSVKNKRRSKSARNKFKSRNR